jgi:hypothetical protein
MPNSLDMKNAFTKANAITPQLALSVVALLIDPRCLCVRDVGKEIEMRQSEAFFLSFPELN